MKQTKRTGFFFCGHDFPIPLFQINDLLQRWRKQFKAQKKKERRSSYFLPLKKFVFFFCKFLFHVHFFRCCCCCYILLHCVVCVCFKDDIFEPAPVNYKREVFSNSLFWVGVVQYMLTALTFTTIFVL